MSKTVITISREFGSGGRTIAKIVAEKLGYEFYDRALVERIAQESGCSPDFVEEHGEDSGFTSSILFNLARSNSGATPATPGIADQLFVTQYNVIRQIAMEGPCVILGHCADYILRDCESALHVFIHADRDFKTARIVRLYGKSASSPHKRLEEKDKKRKVYYKNYTGRTWGLSTNYHISLDSGALGLESCAEVIVRLAQAEN